MTNLKSVSRSTELLEDLSVDYGSLIEDNHESNVLIEVGEEPNFKIFKAHSLILRSRSAYFRVALSNEWAKKDDEGNYVFKKQNINPQTFEIILKFIYCGNVCIDHLNGADSALLLIASDELELHKLSKHVQVHMTEDLVCWLLQNILYVFEFVLKCNDFNILREFLLGIICRDPAIVFGPDKKYFHFDESFMAQILERDDLELDEIKIWEHLIEWGIARTNLHHQLRKDISTWSREDFSALEKTLHNCIPLIRYFQISSPDLYDKVRHPFKKILSKRLNEDIIKYYMKPGYMPVDGILPPRLTVVDSCIIRSIHVSLLCSWIDRKDASKKKFYSCKIPYDFRLLCRGTKDGFDALTFHKKCDDIIGTIVLAKVRGSQKVLGGYNPCSWQRSLTKNSEGTSNSSTSGYKDASNSFIFSFMLDEGLSEARLSRVIVKDKAIYCSTSTGPCFGEGDLWMTGNFGSSIRTSYENSVTDELNFFTDDYEVFHIRDKENI
ncbi:10575_t:CDS:2 [Acaulospora colombiana]|uniref:10575_t:CDS:1 n=1 Tax=Acaulospora colombiana TaxID=27376 RepID=A0ACA9LEQ9_9GLOM|nr:10575_t:CDS:2 [Acaulospora colombiana]